MPKYVKNSHEAINATFMASVCYHPDLRYPRRRGSFPLSYQLFASEILVCTTSPPLLILLLLLLLFSPHHIAVSHSKTVQTTPPSRPPRNILSAPPGAASATPSGSASSWHPASSTRSERSANEPMSRVLYLYPLHTHWWSRVSQEAPVDFRKPLMLLHLAGPASAPKSRLLRLVKQSYHARLPCPVRS